MEELTRRLKRFEKRVRMVRAWRGLAVGLCVGGVLGMIWSALDWFAIFYTEWTWLSILVGICAFVGAAVGFFLKVPVHALAESIDRRAALKERLSTAREHAAGSDMFDQPLLSDASEHLDRLKPASIFPFKMGRWQGGGVALASIAAAIFLLGNTPLLLNDAQKKQLEDLKREGAKVERIIKENLDDPEA